MGRQAVDSGEVVVGAVVLVATAAAAAAAAAAVAEAVEAATAMAVAMEEAVHLDGCATHDEVQRCVRKGAGEALPRVVWQQDSLRDSRSLSGSDGTRD